MQTLARNSFLSYGRTRQVCPILAPSLPCPSPPPGFSRNCPIAAHGVGRGRLGDSPTLTRSTGIRHIGIDELACHACPNSRARIEAELPGTILPRRWGADSHTEFILNEEIYITQLHSNFFFSFFFSFFLFLILCYTRVYDRIRRYDLKYICVLYKYIQIYML